MKSFLLALILAGCAVAPASPDAAVDLLVADVQSDTSDLTYVPAPDALPRVDAQLPMCDNPTLPVCTTGIAPFLGCAFGGRPVEDRCHRVCVACSTARDCQFGFAGQVLVCVGVCSPVNCP